MGHSGAPFGHNSERDGLRNRSPNSSDRRLGVRLEIVGLETIRRLASRRLVIRGCPSLGELRLFRSLGTACFVRGSFRILRPLESVGGPRLALTGKGNMIRISHLFPMTLHASKSTFLGNSRREAGFPLDKLSEHPIDSVVEGRMVRYSLHFATALALLLQLGGIGARPCCCGTDRCGNRADSPGPDAPPLAENASAPNCCCSESSASEPAGCCCCSASEKSDSDSLAANEYEPADPIIGCPPGRCHCQAEHPPADLSDRNGRRESSPERESNPAPADRAAPACVIAWATLTPRIDPHWSSGSTRLRPLWLTLRHLRN
jgi:hypothetical protein